MVTECTERTESHGNCNTHRGSWSSSRPRVLSNLKQEQKLVGAEHAEKRGLGPCMGQSRRPTSPGVFVNSRSGWCWWLPERQLERTHLQGIPGNRRQFG